MNFKKRIISILVYVIGFLICTLVIFYLIYENNKPRKFYCIVVMPQNFCGTQAFEGSPHAVEGKEVFNSYCAACHKLDAKSTGPALRGMDSIIYRKWIIERNLKIDTTKFKKQQIDYHRFLAKEALDSLDIKYLFEYTNRERLE